MSKYAIDQMTSLENELGDTVTMYNELETLSSSVTVIENFGVTKSSFLVMKTLGLLSSTGLESFAFNDNQELPSEEVVLESLTDKIKETGAKWGAKILSVITGFGEKVMGLLTPIWNKMESYFKSISNTAIEKANELKDTIKAHPYGTLITVAGAIVAVAAVAAVIAAGMPGAYANESALSSFIYKVRDTVSKIKMPFTKITTEAVLDGKNMSFVIEEAAGQTTVIPQGIKKLGYTRTAINALFSLMKSGYDKLKAAVFLVGKTILEVYGRYADFLKKTGTFAKKKVVEKTGSKYAGIGAGLIASGIMASVINNMISIVYKLIKQVVIKAYQMISSTLRSIFGSKPEQAAA